MHQVQCGPGLRNSFDLTRLSTFLKNWTSIFARFSSIFVDFRRFSPDFRRFSSIFARISATTRRRRFRPPHGGADFGHHTTTQIFVRTSGRIQIFFINFCGRRRRGGGLRRPPLPRPPLPPKPPSRGPRRGGGGRKNCEILSPKTVTNERTSFVRSFVRRSVRSTWNNH